MVSIWSSILTEGVDRFQVLVDGFHVSFNSMMFFLVNPQRFSLATQSQAAHASARSATGMGQAVADAPMSRHEVRR